MTRVVCDFLHDASSGAIEIACDSRKQKLYSLNRPLTGPITSPLQMIYAKRSIAFYLEVI